MKSVLVTGATAGIGLHTAKSLIELDYKVSITGRDQEKLNEAAKSIGAKPYLCDAGNLEDTNRMIEMLEQENAYFDALVLNAGVFHPRPFEQSDQESFESTLNINFIGPYFTLQALLPYLKNPSSIVYVSSIVVNKAYPNCSAYAASKAAFEGAIGTLNLELAERGIRINSVRPGVTRTDIQKKAGMSDEDLLGLEEQLKHIPVGRILKTGDIVPAITYLVSDSSIGMRNAVLEIDGGFSL